MITSMIAAAQSCRIRAGIALIGVLFLASCQHETQVQPNKQVQTDSVRVNDEDPPVQPGGPGGGK